MSEPLVKWVVDKLSLSEDHADWDYPSMSEPIRVYLAADVDASMPDKQVDKLANGLWSNLEDARVMDYEGTTLNEQECIAILATALLRQREEEVHKHCACLWEATEQIAECTTHGKVAAQLAAIEKVRDEYHEQWMDASAAEDEAKAQLAAMKGPGTPYARWHWLIDELGKRFPELHPYDSSRPSEAYYLESIDCIRAQLAAVVDQLDTVLLQKCQANDENRASRALITYLQTIGTRQVEEIRALKKEIVGLKAMTISYSFERPSAASTS